MTPKEIAAYYNARIFDSIEAAENSGFIITETFEPRNVWNKMSAAHTIVNKLKQRKDETSEIGLVLTPKSISGCYLPKQSE